MHTIVQVAYCSPMRDSGLDFKVAVACPYMGQPCMLRDAEVLMLVRKDEVGVPSMNARLARLFCSPGESTRGAGGFRLDRPARAKSSSGESPQSQHAWPHESNTR